MRVARQQRFATLGTFALLAQAVRFGLVRSTQAWAARLYRCGLWFEKLGDGQSAMYIDVQGQGVDGQPLAMTAQLTAANDKGPQIPSCAAVALTRKLLDGYVPQPGARACVGEVTLDEYLAAINDPENLKIEAWFSAGNA